MRILHTSDWHLGKNLEQINRIEEQREFIDCLCKTEEEQKIDLVLVAGDIYDTYNPSALSLALALSEQIQLKGQSPLEFFFLDEGFGTLDNNLLDSVTDSLERLSRKERVIGLISHVPELRSRIARRLIVDPPTERIIFPYCYKTISLY